MIKKSFETAKTIKQNVDNDRIEMQEMHKDVYKMHLFKTNTVAVWMLGL